MINSRVPDGSAIPGAAPDQRGTDYWVLFTENIDVVNVDLTLLITGETATTGVVSMPGLGFQETFSVTPGAVATVAIPAGAAIRGGVSLG